MTNNPLDFLDAPSGAAPATAAGDDDIDAFVNHRGGEGGKRQGNWKDEKRIITWMHTAKRPVELWRHRFNVLDLREDKDSGRQDRVIVGRDWNCTEDEKVLQKQYKRNDKGRRLIDPRVCPICLLAEWTHLMVAAGKLQLHTPILRYDGMTWQGEGEKRKLTPGQVIVHAGGLFNGMGDAEGDAKQAIIDAGISIKDSWRESVMAKLGYLFTVARNDKLADGVQVSVETQALGDSVKTVIADRMAQFASKGNRDRGNPLKFPYAIEWQYRDEKQNWKDKYHAVYVDPEIAPYTNEVKQVIVDEPYPDTSYYTSPADPALMRATLEAHWCAPVQLPVDRLFANTKASPKSTSYPTPPAQQQAAPPPPPPPSAAPPPAQQQAAPPPAQQQERTGRRRAAPPPPPEPARKLAPPCDSCGEVMYEGQLKCTKCGMEYVDEPEQPAATSTAQGDKLPFDD